ncbi:MAG: HDIG domain-containing protein [Gemmatimonadota bacterium]
MNAPGQRVLGRLSGPARSERVGSWSFHGARALLVLLLAVFISLTFPAVPRTNLEGYSKGRVAPETVIARFNFAVPKSPEELERERAEAAAGIAPTFDVRPTAVDSMSAGLERFFTRLEEVATREGATPDAVRAFVSEAGVPASPAQVAVLANEGARQALRTTALRATRELLPAGVHEAVDPVYASAEQLRLREGERDRTVDRSSVMSVGEFYDAAARRLPVAVASPDAQNLLRLVLIRFMVPSLDFNAVITREERSRAQSAVQLIKTNVLAGEAIVRANEQIGDEELARLDAYAEAQRALGVASTGGWRLSGLVGSTLFHALLLTVFGALLFFFREGVYRNYRWLLVLSALAAAYFAVAAVIGSRGLPYELLPVPFVALTVAVLWDGRMALIFAVLLAVMTGALRPFDAEIVTPTLLVAGSAGALSVRVVRRRSQFWAFMLIIAVAHALAILGVWLMEGRDGAELLTALPWAGLGAAASAILAMGFLPVFEWFTGITTPQTLLEWADPTRPLLGRLAREAPGTYAHTIAVANVAEAAATAIGADGLLCRVGAFYHDVGKMLKPQYFIENQPGTRNPHDQLKPEMSAALVREHVTEGFRLAKESRVPPVILDFILEHHGTQAIGFFREKALEEKGSGAELPAEVFEYPGPRPQTKETAILMLADSVESAARALQDPTRERIRELVTGLIDAKIANGQLDEAPLTLGEIGRVREEIIKVLEGMYHQRIDYPSTRHLTDAPDGSSRTGGAPS